MSKIVVVVVVVVVFVVVVVNYVIKLLLTIGVLDMWLCQMCGMDTVDLLRIKVLDLHPSTLVILI